MKKTLFTLILFIVSTCFIQLFSQSISIGFKGGMNYSNMFEEGDIGTISDNYKFIPGYNAGIMVEIPGTIDMVVETGLFLNSKGFKIDKSGDLASIKGSLKTLYLDVPIKAKYIKSFGDLSLFASGGVYGGYGLSGTLDMEITYDGTTTSSTEDVKWGNDPDNDDLLSIDYGALGSVGVEFKSIILEISYAHGLANISSYTEDNYVINNRTFGISLGYKFGL